MAHADSPPPARPSKEQLKQALKAFKKRLKLTRLDAESELSRSPLTSGKVSGIVAIVATIKPPPRRFRAWTCRRDRARSRAPAPF